MCTSKPLNFHVRNIFREFTLHVMQVHVLDGLNNCNISVRWNYSTKKLLLRNQCNNFSFCFTTLTISDYQSVGGYENTSIYVATWDTNDNLGFNVAIPIRRIRSIVLEFRINGNLVILITGLRVPYCMFVLCILIWK